MARNIPRKACRKQMSLRLTGKTKESGVQSYQGPLCQPFGGDLRL